MRLLDHAFEEDVKRMVLDSVEDTNYFPSEAIPGLVAAIVELALTFGPAAGQVIDEVMDELSVGVSE